MLFRSTLFSIFLIIANYFCLSIENNKNIQVSNEMRMFQSVSELNYHVQKPVQVTKVTSMVLRPKVNIPHSRKLDNAEVVKTVFDIFPNPAGDIINLRFEQPVNENLSIKLFDLIGNEIDSKKAIDGKATFELNQLPKGMYCMVVIFNGKVISQKKFIKK